MVKPHNIAEYRAVNDLSGVQVLTILDCEETLAAWSGYVAAALDRRGESRSRELHARLLAGRLGPAENIQQLRTAFAGRPPITFTDRDAYYFNAIFPPLSPPRAAPEQVTGPLLIPTAISSAILRAGELLTNPQFITTPPSAWEHEARLFRKESLYAEQIRDRPDFRAAVEHLRKKHGANVASLNAPLLARLDDVDDIYVGDNDDAIADELLNDVTVLCGDYALRGLDHDFSPMPKRFEMCMQRDNLRIEVPAYMEFDWRRDFPVATARVLHERGHFMSAINPIRLFEQQRSAGWGVSDDALLKVYDELEPHLRRPPVKKKSWLYEEIAKILPITDAAGPDDIHRVVRRRLKAALQQRGKA